jgi:hypothetical protein
MTIFGHVWFENVAQVFRPEGFGVFESNLLPEEF